MTEIRTNRNDKPLLPLRCFRLQHVHSDIQRRVIRLRHVITGPLTHSVGGQYCFARRRLSSTVTLHGGPVVLRPVRVIPFL